MHYDDIDFVVTVPIKNKHPVGHRLQRQGCLKPLSFGSYAPPTRSQMPERAWGTEAYLPQAPFLRELCAPCPHEGVLRNTPYDPRRSRCSPLSNPRSLHPLGASLLLSLNLCFKVGSSWYGWVNGIISKQRYYTAQICTGRCSVHHCLLTFVCSLTHRHLWHQTVKLSLMTSF